MKYYYDSCKCIIIIGVFVVLGNLILDYPALSGWIGFLTGIVVAVVAMLIFRPDTRIVSIITLMGMLTLGQKHFKNIHEYIIVVGITLFLLMGLLAVMQWLSRRKIAAFDIASDLDLPLFIVMASFIFIGLLVGKLSG